MCDTPTSRSSADRFAIFMLTRSGPHHRFGTRGSGWQTAPAGHWSHVTARPHRADSCWWHRRTGHNHLQDPFPDGESPRPVRPPPLTSSRLACTTARSAAPGAVAGISTQVLKFRTAKVSTSSGPGVTTTSQRCDLLRPTHGGAHKGTTHGSLDAREEATRRTT